MKLVNLLFALLLLMAAAVGLTRNTVAAPLPIKMNPGSAIHTMQKAGRLVTLEGVTIDFDPGTTTTFYDFKRIFADGTAGGTCHDADQSGCFRVPEGQVLVVTDVEYEATGAVTGLSGFLSLVLENLTDPLKRQTALKAYAVIAGGNKGMVREHLTSGFAVSSKAKLSGEFATGGASVYIICIYLRGYLAPDK